MNSFILLLISLPVGIFLTVTILRYTHRKRKAAIPATSGRKPDLLKQTGPYFRIGLILALGFVIAAFSLRQETNAANDYVTWEENTEFIVTPPVTKHKEPKKTPPPKDKPIEKKEPVKNPLLNEVVDTKPVPDSLFAPKEDDIIDDFVIPDPAPVDVNKPWINVEIMPKFPGGESKLLEFLASCPYPLALKTIGASGTVFVSWVVGADGKVRDVEVLRSPYKGFEKTVENHISKMPDWSPGIQQGTKVPVIYTAPIKFEIK